MKDFDATPTAVWSGRVQPIHNGHVEILIQSLDQLPNDHALFVVGPFVPDQMSAATPDYLQQAKVAYESAANPLKAWERFLLASLAFRELPDANRLIISMVPNHALGPEIYGEYYPSGALICTTDKDEFEATKHRLWKSRGFGVHMMHLAKTPLTGTEMRKRVSEGEDWRQFVPEACHELFIDIDGPARVFG